MSPHCEETECEASDFESHVVMKINVLYLKYFFTKFFTLHSVKYKKPKCYESTRSYC